MQTNTLDQTINMETGKIDSIETIDMETKAIDFSGAFKYPRFFLRLSGFWPEIRNIALGVTTFLCMFLLCILSLIDLYQGRADISYATSNAIITCAEIASLYKMWILFTRRDKISALLDAWKDVKTPTHLYRHVTTLQTDLIRPSASVIMYTVLIIGGAPLFSAHAYIIHVYFNSTSYSGLQEEDTYKLPVQVWHPFDFPNNALAYISMYVFQCFTMGLAISASLGFNDLYLTLTILGSRLLDHLKIVMQDLQFLSSQRTDFHDSMCEQRIEATLIYSVRHHQKIVRYIDDLNRLFAPVMLIDIWTTVFVICVTAFHITSVDSPGLRVSAVVVVFLNHMAYFALLSWSANEIIIKSQLVRETCFGTAWFNMSKPCLGILKIVCLRATLPSQLCAGKFYAFSLDTFKALLGLSFSYVMFLNEMQGSVTSEKNLR